MSLWARLAAWMTSCSDALRWTCGRVGAVSLGLCAWLLHCLPALRMKIVLPSPMLHAAAVEVLVLDEADRLLDMGFKAQLDAIMRRLPRQRRTGAWHAQVNQAA